MHALVPMRDVWTIADLDALDVQDWWRYEIVDGALVVTPVAGANHELTGGDLRKILWDAMPQGITVVGPLGVDIAPTYLVPDLVVAERAKLRNVQNLPPRDVLVAVEIVSPGSVTMDRIVKPAKYAAAGIPNYWRIEQSPLSLTAYRLAGDVYAEVGTWQAGDLAVLREPFPVEIEINQLAP